MKLRLLILKHSNLHRKKNPPSTFIDFLVFSPLHFTFIVLMHLVFQKQSHPPHLFQSLRLLILQLLPRPCLLQPPWLLER